MGRVWSGHDERLDRKVALKEVLLGNSDLDARHRDERLARAIREARSAARLTHPGIITIHDVTEHDGAPVIVMEFIQGESLGSLLRRQGRLSIAQAAGIALTVTQALTVAHSAGVVHRDLKPDNIMISGERAIITDFGIAAIIDATAITRTGFALGSPPYMSREQLEGKSPAPEMDLWSLGVTLYEAVEGERPFQGVVGSLIYAICEKEPRPPEHAGPLIPLLRGLLVKDPASRTSAQAAASALVEIVHGFSSVMPEATEPPQPDLTMPSTLHPATSIVTAVASSSDASHLASRGAGKSNSAADAEEGREPRSAPVTEAARFVRASGLGGMSLSSDHELVGHTQPVFALAFNPDGRTLASGGPDWSLRLWDVSSTRLITTLDVGDAVWSLAFSSDGSSLAYGNYGKSAHILDASSLLTQSMLRRHEDAVWSLAFSPDGRKIATCSVNDSFQIWDVESGRALASFEGHSGFVRSVAFSPDGMYVASASYDDTIRLWNVTTGDTAATLGEGGSWSGHKEWVNSVVFSPDGSLIASGSDDRTVRIWDVASASLTGVLEGHERGINSVAFSADGTLVASGSADHTVRLWDTSSCQPLAVLSDHRGSVLSVAFSPTDNHLLASAGDDRVIRLSITP